MYGAVAINHRTPGATHPHVVYQVWIIVFNGSSPLHEPAETPILALALSVH